MARQRGTEMSFDQYNITRDLYTVLVNSDIVTNVNAGAGLIMDDPLSPSTAPQPPFFEQKKLPFYGRSDAENPIDVETIVSASTSFIQTKDTYQLAKSLYANLKASYGFASASASYEYVKQIMNTGEMILAIIEVKSSGPSIDEGDIYWRSPPSSEDQTITTDEERQEQFVRSYGSHYVQAVQHGYRIAISGTFSSSVQDEKQSFTAAFKAAFSGGGAGGGLTAQQRLILTGERTELRAQIVAGAIIPERSVQLKAFDEIKPFLDEIRNGTIRLYRGPVSVLAKSYWHTLLEYPSTRAVLAPRDGQPAESPYGVPAGTIIAWAPRKTDIRVDDLGKRTLKLPDGWALADGSNDTPNLIGKFPMGAISAEDVCQEGGAETHKHTGMAGMIPWDQATNGSGEGHRAVPLGNHQHSLAIDPAAHLPPFGKVLFIVKL